MIGVTTVVAAAAVIVSAMQWIIARQKIAAGALEERLDIYEEIVSIISDFASTGTFPVALHQQFIHAMRRAHFNFGPEVEAYLDELRLAMLRGDDRLGFRADLSETEFLKAYDSVAQEFDRLDRMFAPYMRNDQRISLAWWPQDRRDLVARPYRPNSVAPAD